MLKILKIKNDKKSKDKFWINFCTSEEEKLIISFYKQDKKNKFFFGDKIYLSDSYRKKTYSKFDEKYKNKFFLDFSYYYDPEKTKKIIFELIKTEEFRQFRNKLGEINFDEKEPLYEAKIIQRQENLQEIIEKALQKGDKIYLIGKDAEYYVSMNDVHLKEEGEMDSHLEFKGIKVPDNYTIDELEYFSEVYKKVYINENPKKTMNEKYEEKVRNLSIETMFNSDIESTYIIDIATEKLIKKRKKGLFSKAMTEEFGEEEYLVEGKYLVEDGLDAFDILINLYV